MAKDRNKKADRKPKKNINNGICSYHLHNARSDVHKCKYCGDFFCKEHLEAKPPGMPHFKNATPEERMIMEEWEKPGGHPCVPYYDFWKAEQEGKSKEYRETLDRLLKPDPEGWKSQEFEHIDANLPPINEDNKDTSKDSKTTKFSKIKCFFGFHHWEKLGGPINMGYGKFEQKLTCTRCRKTKSLAS